MLFYQAKRASTVTLSRQWKSMETTNVKARYPMNNYFLVYFDMIFVNKASEGLGYNTSCIDQIHDAFMMLFVL